MFDCNKETIGKVLSRPLPVEFTNRFQNNDPPRDLCRQRNQMYLMQRGILFALNRYTSLQSVATKSDEVCCSLPVMYSKQTGRNIFYSLKLCPYIINLSIMRKIYSEQKEGVSCFYRSMLNVIYRWHDMFLPDQHQAHGSCFSVSTAYKYLKGRMSAPRR